MVNFISTHLKSIGKSHFIYSKWRKIQPAVYIATNQLFNLGHFKKDAIVTLELESKKELDDKIIELKTLQQEQFDSLITKQKAQAIQLKEEVSGTLTGEITVTDPEKTLLYLAIPYEKNWKIMVDGKEVKAKSVLGNFTGIDLTPGKHQLTMHYQQRNFIVGVFISISVLLSVLFYQLSKRFKHRKSK